MRHLLVMIADKLSIVPIHSLYVKFSLVLLWLLEVRSSDCRNLSNHSESRDRCLNAR